MEVRGEPMAEEASQKLRQAMGSKADWSMVVFDFERYNRLLQFADECALKLRTFDLSVVNHYFSVLKQIYINWKPLMHHTYQEHFDKNFKEISDMLYELEKFKKTNAMETGEVRIQKKLPLILEEIHIDLLEFKQLAGLGVPTRTELTEEQKLSRAMD